MLVQVRARSAKAKIDGARLGRRNMRDHSFELGLTCSRAAYRLVNRDARHFFGWEGRMIRWYSMGLVAIALACLVARSAAAEIPGWQDGWPTPQQMLQGRDPAQV